MQEKIDIIEFYIAITNRCNLQCIMCTTGKGKYDSQKELTTGQWRQVITNLNKNCKIQRITFGGGEPLLRRDLAELIKFACSTDIATVNVISNGILLGEEFMASFTEKELLKIGIIFSIDGLEYNHNFIRGTDVFRMAFSNFEYLFYDYFKPQRINSLSLSSILMPDNLANYIPFLEFFKKYDGIRIDIQPVIPNNEKCDIKENFMLTELEKNKLKEIVKYVVENIDISTRSAATVEAYIKYFDNQLIKHGRCLTGYESLNITYEGYPYLCGKEVTMPLYQFDFKDILYSASYQKELERIRECREPCLQGLHLNPEEYGQNS